MHCREKHGGTCINTHMECCDRQTGSKGRWDLDNIKTKRKSRGKREGGRTDDCKNEQVKP